jgi:transcriptional regulator with GAF, ATPase, and Fis domain
VIAATNRDLEKEVLAGNFRSDLFYRLNVFPVVLPPLRERREDIPILAAHFVQKHAKKLDRKLRSFSAKAMKQLTAYSWPGNVRELEHIIERSMLMAKGNVISQVPLPEMDAAALQAALPDAYIKTIDEVEREHIITVLRKTNGKVAGIGGAAALFRIPSTTLNSKIRRLQIKKGFINQPK